LSQIRSNLFEGLGIEVTISRITSRKNSNSVNSSFVKIAKISPTSPASPTCQNHGESVDKGAGDILIAKISMKTVQK
jgi:hypothetical protein